MDLRGPEGVRRFQGNFYCFSCDEWACVRRNSVNILSFLIYIYATHSPIMIIITRIMETDKNTTLRL